MKTFRTFNPVEFNSYVKLINENVKHVLSNSRAKYVIYQAGVDNNFNVEDVYSYLHSITSKSYPHYSGSLLNRNWRKIYENFMEDVELAPRLQQILETSPVKPGNDFLRDCFFDTVKDMGINPDIMRIDMSLDLFGWYRTLRLIIKEAEETPFTGSFVSEIRCELKSLGKHSKSASKKRKHKVKSGGNYMKSIGQYTLEGELKRRFSSVSEAIKETFSETGVEYKDANIYRAIRTGGTAYGFKWRTDKKVSQKGKSDKPARKKETVGGGKQIGKLKDTGVSVERKHVESGVSGLLVAFYLNKDKSIDRNREIGRFCTQQEACNSLGINKGVLSNYLKGRKDSIFWNNENGQKVRIGVEKLAA